MRCVCRDWTGAWPERRQLECHTAKHTEELLAGRICASDVHTVTLVFPDDSMYRFPDSPLYRGFARRVKFRATAVLANIWRVYLPGCSFITDVRPLANAHTVSLRGCTGVTDVSPLCNVRRLDISHCRGITNVDALCNVMQLNMRDCTGVRSVAALRGVRRLCMADCPLIDSLDGLQSIEELDMSFNCRITSLEPLRSGGIRVLCAISCQGIADLAPLHSVRALRISKCHGVRRVAGLHSVRALLMDSCKHVSSIADDMPLLRVLDMSFCSRIGNIDQLAAQLETLYCAGTRNTLRGVALHTAGAAVCRCTCENPAAELARWL